MEILILSCLARQPMHGYEIKVELRYRHVKWWAKCDHGHLYATLPRLEKRELIRRLVREEEVATGKRERRIYKITEMGCCYLRAGLLKAASAADPTYFELDLFLSACLRLDRDVAIAALECRGVTLQGQLDEAQAGIPKAKGLIPVNGRLIIEHRAHHIASELAFLEHVLTEIRAYEPWTSPLGTESVTTFVERTGALLEEEVEDAEEE
ncbi:MAG: DNA-binding PadR family transcriptional regulator [Myxococcota bacterium]|jgi:DNA-binding PadR family transcriptional regulator